MDYLEEGDSLDDFLKDFPTVSREHAVAALLSIDDLRFTIDDWETR